MIRNWNPITKTTLKNQQPQIPAWTNQTFWAKTCHFLHCKTQNYSHYKHQKTFSTSQPKICKETKEKSLEQTNLKARKKKIWAKGKSRNKQERKRKGKYAVTFLPLWRCYQAGPNDDNTLEMVILLHVECMKEGTQPEAATWVERRSSRFRGDAKVASPALLLYLSLFAIFLFF